MKTPIALLILIVQILLSQLLALGADNSAPSPEPVFVSGAVKTPGAVPMAPGMTVLAAINAAGGFNTYADRANVKIVTRDPKTQKMTEVTVDVGAAIKNPKANVLVQPGDLIYVRQRIFDFKDSGGVK